MAPIQPPEAFNATKIELHVLNRMLYTIDVVACITFTSNGISGVRTSSEMESASMPSKVQKTFFHSTGPTKRFRSSQKNRAKKISVHAYSGDVIL
jgi:hypothetical protein